MVLKTIYTIPQNVNQAGEVWKNCLYGASFASSETGWVIGSGQILFTNNSGKSWKNFYSNKKDLPYSHGHRIFCASFEECWIPSFFKNECCYTKDQGKTWNVVTLKEGIFPSDIFFIDSKIGWIVGDDKSYKPNLGEICFTNDSGKNWYAHPLNLFGKAVKVKFLNQKRGWLLENYLTDDEFAMKTNLYRTDDGGLNWVNIISFDGQGTDFDILGKNRLIIAGESGSYFIATDDGKSCENLKIDEFNINALSFFDSRFGIAVCDFGIILSSEDGGQSWLKIENEVSENFVSVCITGSTEGFIVSCSSIYSFRL